jgi:hypothetical protein
MSKTGKTALATIALRQNAGGMIQLIRGRPQRTPRRESDQVIEHLHDGKADMVETYRAPTQRS